MSDKLILLTPMFVFLIVAVFRFAGCAPFSEDRSEATGTVAGPPLVAGPGDPSVPPPPPGPTYEDVVKNTAGFAALWPFNESGGNVANVVGPLNPAANGLYVAPGVPAGTGFSVGQNGVLFPKESNDFAPSFDGTAARVEVQFNGPLNPDKSVPGFTIELWVKPNPNLGPVTQVLLSSHRFDSAAVQQGYEIALIRNPAQPNQQIRGRVYANNTMTEMTVTPLTGDPGEWRYVVMTYETAVAVPRTVSLTVRIAKTPDTYKDGPHSAAYESVIATKPSTLRFGAGHAIGQTAENFFAGELDNIAFYNVALAQADLDKRFNMF